MTGLYGTLHLKFPQDFLPIPAHRVDTDGKQNGNILAHHTIGYQPNNLYFPIRQNLHQKTTVQFIYYVHENGY